MVQKYLETPVLFLIFKRPDVTQLVFNEIRRARPKSLYVRADGPRAHVQGEIALCAETRAIIDQVDWDCKVYKNYSDVNLGCRRSLSSGIQWFFENVEEGIILEDDCLPSQSFFWYCQELLEKYRDDTRIMQINGVNYLDGTKIGEATYYFAKISDVTGWASWRRSWKYYDMNMKKFSEFKKQKQIHNYFSDKQIAAWLMCYFQEAMELEKCGIWSSQWSFAKCAQNGLTICPNVPLVAHIGWDEQGTNFNKGYHIYPKITVQDIDKIIHPEFVLPNQEADRLRFKLIQKTDPHAQRLFQLKRSLKMYLKDSLSPEDFERLIKIGRILRGQKVT